MKPNSLNPLLRKICASSAIAILIMLAMPGAVAAPGWSAPVELSPPLALINLQFDGSVALDPYQNSVAVWNANGIIQASTQIPGGTYSAAVNISQNTDYEETIEPRVALNPRGADAAMAIWSSVDRVPRQVPVNAIKVATKLRNGTWTAPLAITTSTTAALGSPRIALDALGNAFAVWQNCGPGACAIQAATKPIGHGWSAPVTISGATTNATYPQLAVSPLGQAVAVWQAQPQGGSIQAASKRPGDAWGAAEDISSPGMLGFSPKVAIDAQGRAVAVWNENPAIVAATRAVNGQWSVPAVLTSGLDLFSSRGPDVGMDRAGNVTAAWSGLDNTNFSNLVYVANVRPGAPWSAPIPVSSADVEDPGEPRVAVAPGGLLNVVTWVDNSQNVARAATQLRRTAWGTPVTLGNAIYDTPVEIAASVGPKARAFWGIARVTQFQQAWIPAVASFSP